MQGTVRTANTVKPLILAFESM